MPTDPSPDPGPDPTPDPTPDPSPGPPPRPLDNSRAQPALVAYGNAAAAAAYAHEGALVVAGRDNYADPQMRAVSEAGGTVLVYLDPIIDADHGRYHRLLHQQSACGPAVPRWPGDLRANQWGNLADFRPGGVLQAKLACVLETIATENPHVGGFFLDDVGSRSWFPDFSWAGLGRDGQQAYRDGAIDIVRTARGVADRHGLMVMVNGTWAAGSLAGQGGGFPDPHQHGNALADGMVSENHDGAFWARDYPCGGQWAAQSPLTQGKAFHLAITRTPPARREFVDSGCYSWVTAQADYGVAAPPWAAFSPTGLPSRVRRP